MSTTLSLKRDSDLRSLVAECASQLEAALALQVGNMDSDSKRARIEGERMQIVAHVAERLRSAT